jgi:predicted RNase H-like HicB family nuclease
METKSQLVHVTDSNGNNISIDATIPLFTKKTDGYWLVYSPHFKTFGYSKESEKQAVQDLDRALTLFFDVHLERGTLEKALLAFGWTKVKNTLHKPKLGNRPALSRSKAKMEHRLQVPHAA